METRTTDLSESGCYVDTMNPFPKGMEIKVRLMHNEASFHATARVAHRQPGVGMGLLFTYIDPVERPVLDRWLAELRGDVPALVPVSETVEPPRRTVSYRESVHANGERAALQQLVHALVQKRLLNDDDAGKILRHLSDIF
jgi:hypothetical protein